MAIIIINYLNYILNQNVSLKSGVFIKFLIFKKFYLEIIINLVHLSPLF